MMNACTTAGAILVVVLCSVIVPTILVVHARMARKERQHAQDTIQDTRRVRRIAQVKNMTVTAEINGIIRTRRTRNT